MIAMANDDDQLDLFDPERSERNRILAYLAENHKEYLDCLRAFAREHALRFGSVTIDDVHTEIARHRFPTPADVGIDNRVLGALFTPREFQAVQQVSTKRQEVQARSGAGRTYITRYVLRASAMETK